MVNILIKYCIEGEFHERNSYEILFDYNKASNFITLENKNEEADDFLKEMHGKFILMEYRGITRLDGLKMFVLNTLTIKREYKLNEILK